MSGATPVTGSPMATEPGAPLGPAPMAADTLATARPASLWRDTLGSVLHQRSAVVGLTILTIMVLVALFALSSNAVTVAGVVRVNLGDQRKAGTEFLMKQYSLSEDAAASLLREFERMVYAEVGAT